MSGPKGLPPGNISVIVPAVRAIPNGDFLNPFAAPPTNLDALPPAPVKNLASGEAKSIYPTLLGAKT